MMNLKKPKLNNLQRVGISLLRQLTKLCLLLKIGEGLPMQRKIKFSFFLRPKKVTRWKK
jgi:hypothetical protein